MLGLRILFLLWTLSLGIASFISGSSRGYPSFLQIADDLLDDVQDPLIAFDLVEGFRVTICCFKSSFQI